MTNALAVYEQMNALTAAATALHQSGFFRDVTSQAQAMVKVMAGAEIGLPPFASMSGIHIVQGKPVLGANLVATLVKNDPRYDYRVKVADNDHCVLTWYEGGRAVGESSFTMQEANAAGLTNKPTWKAYASDMLFARALTRGARRYAPGIFGGAPVYTPDEMGVETDEDGHIVQGEVINVTPPPAQPARATGKGQNDDLRAVVEGTSIIDRGVLDNMPRVIALDELHRGGKSAHTPATDPGPLADDDTAISEANGDFANVAAAFLSTDALTIKKRMGKLKLSVPRNGQQRIEVYRALKADMGKADDIMAQQPALVTDDPDARQAALATAQGQMD